jgi:transposase
VRLSESSHERSYDNVNKLCNEINVVAENRQLNGRKVPNQVLEYLRKIAVHAVEERGYSPEVVIGILGLSRSCIYDWLQRYQTQGVSGLESQPATGAEGQLTETMEIWLKETVLHSTPVGHGYSTLLWNRNILAVLLYEWFGLKLTGRAISGYLKKLGLSYLKPYCVWWSKTRRRLSFSSKRNSHVFSN